MKILLILVEIFSEARRETRIGLTRHHEISLDFAFSEEFICRGEQML